MYTHNTLGNNGRFGNQLFQYAFSTAIANKLKRPLAINKDWVGNRIFKNLPHIDQTKTHQYPRICVDSSFVVNSSLPYISHVDLYGYCQAPYHLAHYSVGYAKNLFRFRDDLCDILNSLIPKEDYVAVHKRRGDYQSTYYNTFAIVSDKSYDDQLLKLKNSTDNLSMFDNIVVCGEESPNTHPDLPDDLQFLCDFWIMMNAKVLLRSNSTFSWWAHTLSNNNQEIWSPQVGNKAGWQNVSFSPNNYEACIWQPPNHMELKLL